MDEVWVANASPVIILAKAGHLHLLEQLARELLLPEPVAAEILSGPASDPARQALQRGWGLRTPARRSRPELREWGLGPGETAVLEIALERSPCTAVLDDAAARRCAKALSVPIIGTLAVVLRAKRGGLVASAAEVIRALRAAGLYVDDHIVRSALEHIGEQWT